MDNPPSTTNIHTIVKAQIVFLLSTLTEENFERNQIEIRSLSEQHGIDTYLHFIRRLIVHSQTRLSAAPTTSFDASTALTFRLLVQETQRLARDPFLAERFRDGVGGGEGEIFRHFDLLRFVDRVGLRPLERFILASAIIAGRTRQELLSQALNIVMLDFDNAVAALSRPTAFDGANLNINQTAKILSNLFVDAPPEPPVLTAAQKQTLIEAARTKYGKEAFSPILGHIFATLSLPPAATIVQTFVQFGPVITSDPELARALFERFGITDSTPPRDAQAIEIISTLAKLAAEGNVLCDVHTLVHVLSSYPTTLNWPAAIKTAFDRPDRSTVDTATLKLLIAILLSVPREAEPHAVAGFWEPWSNPLYQLRLLDSLLSLPADTFNFVQLPGKRIVTVDDVSIASPTIKSLAANVQGHTWNSLELFQVLVKLAESESQDVRNCVKEMLDKAIKISAELVHMGLLQVPDASWNDIRLEYSRKLLAMFLAGHPNHQLVFMRIWQIQPSYLTTAFRDFYDENNLNITRILDVAQDLKILEALLEVQPFTFALDVAALASRREYLNLDKWLADNVATHGADFLHSVILFLQQKMESEKTARLSDPAVESRTMALSPNTITIILRVLRNNSNLMPEADVEASIEVRNACLQIHPRLMSLAPGTDIEPGLTVITYTNEIEAEVDGIYKQMYDTEVTIDDVVAMLQRYKESTNTHDHEVFSCMIHFLFDEYKFFQSYYPQRELDMTGYLFGSLIRHKLIDFIPLGIAIRYIIDALNCAPNTNLFRFGMRALNRFEYRLGEWRPLCEALVQIPALAEHRPDLIANIHRHLASDSSGSDPFANGTGTADQRPVFTSIQPDPVENDLETPPEDVTDRILFIVNNLAPSNFDAKLKEMQEHFADQYARWFANYLVDQRVSTEPNNHPLYLRFLDALDRQPLHKCVLQETYVKAAALLNSERCVQSGSDRNTLKNVGSWLGTITLARDRPIKYKNLSFKELLLEGFEHNRLIVAIPFVCKTLEPCSKSRVFRAPNPWLMAVIGLLAELYHFADLKLNLKFEIEVLCKALNIDLDAVEPTSILRNRPSEAGALGAQEFGSEMEPVPIGTDPATTQAIGAHIESLLLALANTVQISPQFTPLNANPLFKRAVQLAVDRAVREIIIPVVERSVTIAGISTSELVVKDFATELNEGKLRRAGYLMAQKLAGSLALVTCKEPLKTNLGTHLRQYLNEHGFTEQHVPDAVVQILVQDNLDNACSTIEKAAMDRVVADVDESFAASYEARRRHREARPNVPFWDPAAPRSAFPASLPDPLRIKPNGLQPHQLGVYEDFNADAKRLIASRPGSATSFSASIPFMQSPSVDHQMLRAGGLSHEEAMERFLVITRDLEAVISQIPAQSLAVLPPNHDIRVLFSRVLALADEAADPERTPLMISQKVVQLLYKTQSQLGREVYVGIIENLCANFDEVSREAISWFLYAEDERKYNIPVTITLLQCGLLPQNEHDQHLAKSLYTDPRPNFVAYALGLIRESLTGDPPPLSQTYFQFSIEIIRQLVGAGKANEEMTRLLEDLRGGRRSADIALRPPMKPETEQLREKLHMWFQNWVTVFQRTATPEKSFVPFITNLTKNGILKAEDVSSFFFRVCTEASVNAYIKCIATGEFDFAFQALDAFSRLIVYIIKYHGDAAGVNNEQAKVHYFTKILSIFVLVLANTHEEQGPEFQQKPFFRFFSSLLSDLHSMEGALGPAYFQLLIAMSDTFSSLQPTYFPGFAFSWMCLVSHRLFMPKLLLRENKEGWSAYHKLLLSLFKFLTPFVKEGDVRPAERDLYRGALRLLLVLLHDFPDFLSEYYFTLCDSIHPTCIQLRNIVLSAFPPAIHLPDPHLNNVALDSIEMGPIPPLLSDFTSGLRNGDLRVQLDQYLLNRGNPSFLSQLKETLVAPEPNADGGYNLSLINAIVMYIGVSSVAQAKSRSGSSLFVATDPGAVALQYLASNLDLEGQHHLLTSVVLHLRYPNAHTHWFCSLILHLFVEVKDDRFREVMTKVLLERFIVHRPHPWGALVTFIELLRNPKYEFWGKEFIRISPEITMLLESVGRNL